MNLKIRRLNEQVATSFAIVAALSFHTTWQASAAEIAHHLQVRIVPQFDGAPLNFDRLENSTSTGQQVSVTRLDFLLSELFILNENGSWVPLLSEQDQVAYISGREGRTTFLSADLRDGRYTALKFNVGLPPELNHSDPARYPAGHALNPNVNGLHWSWMDGYVFLALEGHWKQANALAHGYSCHLATDPHLRKIQLPIEMTLHSDCELQLGLDIAKALSTPHKVEFSSDLASTHSRTNDSLATHLRDNVQRAFSVLRLNSFELAKRSKAQSVQIAAGAHPYPFTMSAIFPRPALPEDNPLTEEGIALGERLFFDSQLSRNNSQSCATCHQPASAFSDTTVVSMGADGRMGTRNAMPLLNLAWKSSFFWDGRTASLREQVLQPIQNPIEMHETLSNVVTKLARPLNDLTGGAARNQARATFYPSLFSAAFGTPDITADRIARALEQFLLAQTSYNSKFDRVLKGDDSFTAAEQRGFELFHTEYDPRRDQFGADCFHCHGGPLFQSQTFANNGLDEHFKDPGRSLITGKNVDAGKFSVPSLRNVELSGPYMHDGRFETLDQVVDHYSGPLKRSSTLDPNLAKHPDQGLKLSPQDKQALVAFLKTLTDDRFRTRKEPLQTAATASRL